MKIAVVGSWHQNETEFPSRRSFDEFKTACNQIGASIASAGHSIVLGSETETTADRNVFDGFVRILEANPIHNQAVVVVHPNDGREKPFKSVADTHSWIRYTVPKFSGWGGTHLVFVKEADAVLVVGGRNSSYLTGWAAIFANKMLVPVAAFGGAAERLLAELEVIADRKTYQQLMNLNNWSNDACKQLIPIFSSRRKKIAPDIDNIENITMHELSELWKCLSVRQAWSLITFAVTLVSVVAGFGYWVGRSWPGIL